MLTLAGLCWGFSPKHQAQFLAPGSLTSAHAQLLRNDGMTACAACHETAQNPAAFSLANVFGAGHHSTTQSLLCLKCHTEQFPSEFMLAPHNLDPQQLREITARTIGVTVNQVTESHASIACATCHREHQGPDAELSRMTDRQCQSCHANVFHRFETDHVEFAADYPARRRSRIAFDHARHMSIHFIEKNRTFDCRMCHIGDAQQNVQKLVGFEQSCRECHEAQIVQGEGFSMLSLPWVDLGALGRAGVTMPPWPGAAGQQFDGQLSPLLKVLLAANPDVARTLAELPSGFQFGDVDPSNPEHVQRAATIAQEIARLVDEFSVDPRDTIERRMSQSLGCAPDSLDLQQWLSSLPLDELSDLKQIWFGSELSETTPHGDASAQGPATAVPDATEVRTESQEAETNRATQSEPAVENTLLAANPLQGIDWEQLLQESAPNLTENPTPVMTETVPAPNTLPMPPSEVPPTATVAVQSPGGVSPWRQQTHQEGWRIDRQTHSVAYRPRGHADPSLAPLLVLVASSERKGSDPVIAELFRSLTNDVAVGTCSKCHTIDRQGAAHRIQWKAEYRDPALRSFTKFSHAPHVLGGTSAQCQDCHQLDAQRSNAEHFRHDNPFSFQSNFAPLRIHQCAACHQQGMASPSCTTCHHYHVGSRVRSGK